MATAPNHPNFPPDRFESQLAALGLQNARSRQEWLDCHQAEIDSLEDLMQRLTQARVEAFSQRDRRAERDQLRLEARYILGVFLNQVTNSEN